MLQPVQPDDRRQVSYLRKHDPDLFAAYLMVRDLDPVVVEIFDDLETVGRLVQSSAPTGSDLVTTIIADLIDELRRRIAACEENRNGQKE